MQAQGVLFGQITAVFCIVVAGVWGPTQWTAAALGYQLRLGSPWFDLYGTSVYYPWKLFEWWFFFDAYAPQAFDTGGMIAAGSGLLAVVVAIAMSVWRSHQVRKVTTYSSARWADAADIRKAGLTQAAGVFLGQHDGYFPKVRWRSAITGRRLRTRSWSGASCMCSMQARTRRCAASPISSPTRPTRSS